VIYDVGVVTRESGCCCGVEVGVARRGGALDLRDCPRKKLFSGSTRLS
jgi:hypothetical protein